MQKIRLIGMNDKLIGAFRLTFSQQKPQRYQVAESDETGVIYIIDADMYNGGYTLFKENHKNDLAVVIATENLWGIPDELFITRPLRVATLFEKLEHAVSLTATHSKPSVYIAPKRASVDAVTVAPKVISVEQKSTAVSMQPVKPEIPAIQEPQKITVNIPSPLPVFSMQHLVINSLIQARKNKTSVALVWKTGKLVVDAEKTRVYSSDELNSHSLCLDGKTPIQTRPVQDNDKASDYTYTLDNALWLCVYHLSNGRLTDDLQATTPMNLRRWPNLTRMAVWPNTIRICAFMARTPCNILIMTKMLGIDYQEVLSTVSAMKALDLITVKEYKPVSIDATPTPKVEQTEPVVNTQQRSFLSKIMSKIKGL